MTEAASVGGVQSISRVLDLLEAVAATGGEMAISEIATATGLPTPTIHRLVQTLVKRGYMRQLPSRRYALGPRLIPLGEVASTTLGTWARPLLSRLVEELGESANVGVLDGDLVVYIGQVPSRHSMRMFTEVGRRVHPHCTAVGKAMLAQLPDEQVRDLLARTGMPAQTAYTIIDADELIAQLHKIRRQGYAIDEGEQEVGVRCVAVAVPQPALRMAVSVSGPAPRMTPQLIERAVPLLHDAARALAAELVDRTSA